MFEVLFCFVFLAIGYFLGKHQRSESQTFSENETFSNSHSDSPAWHNHELDPSKIKLNSIPKVEPGSLAERLHMEEIPADDFRCKEPFFYAGDNHRYFQGISFQMCTELGQNARDEDVHQCHICEEQFVLSYGETSSCNCGHWIVFGTRVYHRRIKESMLSLIQGGKSEK